MKVFNISFGFIGYIHYYSLHNVLWHGFLFSDFFCIINRSVLIRRKIMHMDRWFSAAVVQQRQSSKRAKYKMAKFGFSEECSSKWKIDPQRSEWIGLWLQANEIQIKSDKCCICLFFPH